MIVLYAGIRYRVADAHPDETRGVFRLGDRRVTLRPVDLDDRLPAEPSPAREQAAECLPPETDELNDLLRDLRPRMFGIANGLWHNADEREDMVQEGLIRAAAAFERFTGGDREKLVRWLMWQAKWAMLDWIRTQLGRRGIKVQLRNAASLQAENPDGTPAFEPGADDVDLAESDLFDFIACHGFTDREQVILRQRYDGYGLKEIGADLGVSESRACQMKKKLFDRLRSVEPL